MEIDEFLDGCAQVGRTHPQRAAVIAEATSVVFARAHRRARARLAVVARTVHVPSLTAALTADEKARLLPALSAEDLGLDDFDEELEDGVGPTVRKAGIAVLALLGLTVVSHRAQGRLDAQVGQLGEIGNDARLRVAEALTAARADGLTVGEAVDVVAMLDRMATGESADVGKGQAAGLDGGLTQATALDEGLAPYRAWLTQSDDRVRDTHAEAESQVVDIDEPFDVGGEPLMYPRDPDGSAAETANCRCFLGFAATLEDAENGIFVTLSDGDE